MSTTAFAASPSSTPRAAWQLPYGLIAYWVCLLTLAITVGVQYRQHADFPMTFWRIALGSVTNVSCALLGCFLVLRRMSLLGDAISHAVLPGIVIAFLATGQLGGFWILAGAAIVGLLTTILTQLLTSSGQVAEDSSMGIVYTGLFATGVLLVNYFARQTHIDPDCVLYGAIDTATVGIQRLEQVPHRFFPLAFVLGVIAAVIVFAWKELKLVAFDPALATAMGYRVNWIHYGLMSLVAVAVVASFEVVGSIIVVAMLIIPAATAFLLTERLHSMLAWAATIGIGSAVAGDLTATLLNTSVAGMMSVAASLHLAAAVILAPRSGFVFRWWRNWLLSVRIAREDILATLYRQEEATAEPRPRPPSWLLSFARLSLLRQGLLTRTAGKWALTSAGRETARSIVRAHRLWETYLQKHFNLPADHLHEPAERMEHFIDEQLQAELLAELDNETHDPHGRKIPGDTN